VGGGGGSVREVIKKDVWAQFGMKEKYER
jgi:hypothetical protein